MFSPEQSSQEVALIAKMIFDITIKSPDLGNARVDPAVLKRAIKAAVESLKNDLEGSESTPAPAPAPAKEESASQTPKGRSFRDKLARFKQIDSGKPLIPQKPTLGPKPVMKAPMTHQKKEYNTNGQTITSSRNDTIASIKERLAQITGKNTATAWKKKQSDENTATAWKKKQSGGKTAAEGKKPQSDKTATAWKKKHSEKKTAAEGKKPQSDKTAAAWKKKQSEKNTATAWKKKQCGKTAADGKKPQSGKKIQRTCGTCHSKFMTNFTGENPSCYSCFKNAATGSKKNYSKCGKIGTYKLVYDSDGTELYVPVD